MKQQTANLKYLIEVLKDFPIETKNSYIRLGSVYGGWNVVPEFLHRGSCCYCFGAGEDITFDVELAHQYGCSVYIFDPTPRARAHVMAVLGFIEKKSAPLSRYKDIIDIPIDLIKYHSIGIWDKDGDVEFYVPPSEKMASHSILNIHGGTEKITAPCRSFHTITTMFGHETVDLVKLDVEGAEYAALTGILESAVKPKQLLVEFDEGWSPTNEDFVQRIKSCIAKLYISGYRINAVEDWNFSFVLRDN